MTTEEVKNELDDDVEFNFQPMSYNFNNTNSNT